jgi:hypothetical protein
MLAGGNSDCFAALTEIQRAKIRTGGRNRVWAFWELCVERLKLAVRRVETAWDKYGDSLPRDFALTECDAKKTETELCRTCNQNTARAVID